AEGTRTPARSPAAAITWPRPSTSSIERSCLPASLATARPTGTPVCTWISMSSAATNASPTKSSFARWRKAPLARDEKTVATANAVTAAISANASASHQRMLSLRPLTPTSIARSGDLQAAAAGGAPSAPPPAATVEPVSGRLGRAKPHRDEAPRRDARQRVLAGLPGADEEDEGRAPL